MPGDAPHPGLSSPPAAEIDRASALCLRPPPGRFAGLFGAGAHRLALRALALPLLSGEPAVIVDGGNRFDPYEIVRAERALGGSGREALSHLLVSRAFTCHQMEALLSRRLDPALARSGARLAVVLGLPETFADADVPFAEACRVFRGCLAALRRSARGGTRVVLAGGEIPADGGRAGFLRHLVRAADPCLLLRREEDRAGTLLQRKTQAQEMSPMGDVPRKGVR
ncbi:MAG TPA: hypothetical protein DD658_04560 [Deltaproteobacteria bacterium]|nr:MAG: hypothetical protein A2X88_06130 [Deltaproteobacteria bacterium GWC2_65_14]HBO69440.1 hypothetical protein [Deltaproteobacteria bacterium]